MRYAASDGDVVAVHQFLCVVAGPTLPGPIDGKDSATEVWRCANHDVVLMAVRDGLLIGTLGLTNPKFWWNTELSFLVNRFFFCLPGSGAWLPLLREAKAIAVASEKELHIISETRAKVLILNKSGRRARGEEVSHLLRKPDGEDADHDTA